MAEYIEREALIDWLTKPTGFKTNCEDCTSIDCLDCIVGEAIRNAPTVDVVPVVRCKDCGNGKPCRDGYVLCSHPAGKRLLMTSSDFCSYGKRKGGED